MQLQHPRHPMPKTVRPESSSQATKCLWTSVQIGRSASNWKGWGPNKNACQQKGKGIRKKKRNKTQNHKTFSKSKPFLVCFSGLPTDFAGASQFATWRANLSSPVAVMAQQDPSHVCLYQNHCMSYTIYIYTLELGGQKKMVLTLTCLFLWSLHNLFAWLWLSYNGSQRICA